MTTFVAEFATFPISQGGLRYWGYMNMEQNVYGGTLAGKKTITHIGISILIEMKLLKVNNLPKW